MTAIEEEWRARAIRAHRAWVSAMSDVTGVQSVDFATLSFDEQRAWDAAGAAAHAYRPRGEANTTSKRLNLVVLLEQVHTIVGKILEELTPPAE